MRKRQKDKMHTHTDWIQPCHGAEYKYKTNERQIASNQKCKRTASMYSSTFDCTIPSPCVCLGFPGPTHCRGGPRWSAQSGRRPRSSAPGAAHWGQAGSARAPPGTRVYPGASAGAGDTGDSSWCTERLCEEVCVCVRKCVCKRFCHAVGIT